MPLSFFAIVVLLTFYSGSAEPNYPELNPELEMFQDMSKAFPLTEPWYLIYRNYDEDPVFGDSKCIRLSEDEEETDGGYPLKFEYGQGNGPSNLVLRLESSEGYTAKNRFSLEVEDQDEPLTLYVSFVDPDAQCTVSRNTYVDETACTVAVPESQLGNQLTSCDFIYGILCGVYKYQLYDDTCKGEE
ncbi:hypothetical protein ISCGN_011074 [Ixodes scapularis]